MRLGLSYVLPTNKNGTWMKHSRLKSLKSVREVSIRHYEGGGGDFIHALKTFDHFFDALDMGGGAVRG